MNELTEILAQATKGIAAEYFRLNIDGGDPIFRERVYCYELYHQMRSRWPTQGAHILNGEVDKRAHPILKKLGADYPKPDLLVHTPGAMAGNYAIIEIKHSLTPEGIQKDLQTLNLFLRKVKYQRAIYLVYGDEANQEGVLKIQVAARKFKQLRDIELWLHPQYGQPATLAMTLCQMKHKINTSTH